MNAKNLIITIVCSVVCLGGGIAIGSTIPRGDETSVSTSQEQKKDADSKYEGIYIADYYDGGRPATKKLYLNKDHNCVSPDNKYSFAYCEWKIEGDRLVILEDNNGGSLGRNMEECESIKSGKVESTAAYEYSTSYAGVGTLDSYRVVELDENHRSYSNGYRCMVISRYSRKYDILSDGSFSLGNQTYYKRK